MSGGILSFFRGKKPTSASVAKERLQILVAHERSSAKHPDWMPQLQNEILQVVRKYIEIEGQDLAIDIRNDDDNNVSVLEINIDGLI